MILSGCVVPDEPVPADETGLTLPPVNLLEAVMLIDFPQDKPSALIVLNVTKEMWARPTFWVPTAFATVRPWPEPVPAPHWVLCPSLRVEGLPEDAELVTLPFWVRDGTLVPAMEQMFGTAFGNGERQCVGARAWNGRQASIAADEPFAGTLAVLVAAAPRKMTFPADPAPFPAFRIEVGIATEPCPENEAAWCPPEALVPAEPLVRGGPVLHALYTGGIPTYAAAIGGFPTDSCADCGFEVEDRRTRIGDVTSGTATARRSSGIESGLTFAKAGIFALGTAASARVTYELTANAETLRLACEDTTRTGNVGVYGIAPHRAASDFLATFDIHGAHTFQAESFEIPLDLESTGWTLPPTVTAAFSGSIWGSTAQFNMC